MTGTDPQIDLNKCPGCGGPADNGHDRCLPPSPYFCSKCEKQGGLWQQAKKQFDAAMTEPPKELSAEEALDRAYDLLDEKIKCSGLEDDCPRCEAKTHIAYAQAVLAHPTPDSLIEKLCELPKIMHEGMYHWGCKAVLDIIKGELHTVPQGGEEKRNECDCLRRPDSEGIPTGIKPVSPAKYEPGLVGIGNKRIAEDQQREISDTEVLETAYSKTYEDAQLWKRRYLELKAQREPVSIEVAAKAMLRDELKHQGSKRDFDTTWEQEKEIWLSNAKAIATAWGLKYVD